MGKKSPEGNRVFLSLQNFVLFAGSSLKKVLKMKPFTPKVSKILVLQHYTQNSSSLFQ